MKLLDTLWQQIDRLEPQIYQLGCPNRNSPLWIVGNARSIVRRMPHLLNQQHLLLAVVDTDGRTLEWELSDVYTG